MRKTNKRFYWLLLCLAFFITIFISLQKLPLLFKKEPKTFFNLKKETITQLKITDNNDIVNIVKNGNSFMAGDFPADEERIYKIIDSLLQFAKDEFVSTNKNKYADFEVDGRRKIEFDQHVVYIGKNYSYAKSYARVDSDPRVYILNEDLSNVFYPKDFRDLKVYLVNSEEKVDKVDLSWSGKKIVLTKKDNKWLLNNNKEAKKERVDFFLNDLKTLKGDDIFGSEKNDLSKLPVELTVFISESKKEKKAVFYKKDKEKFYFFKEDSKYIYQIPTAYVASLKKEEKDLTE